jgi:hypothetical protein
MSGTLAGVTSLGSEATLLGKMAKLPNLCSQLYKVRIASLPRLVTPAKVPDMAAQLQGMFGTPWGFVSAKTKFLTVSSRRNGHPQI